ncbi:hypothetical protein [Membranihabitans marinus]|uniref:hypothetical protein n=1 Tax=Membranihabitans marinus TaxID=1227546 RepID=UPI001F45B2C6|nr:hypothetical protein [Membranihabitans marinus]
MMSTPAQILVSALVLVLSILGCQSEDIQTTGIEMTTFEVDVTPPIGSPVAYAPTRSVTEPLLAKGIILRTAAKTIVLCAFDWIGIGNESQDIIKQALAEAADTEASLVSVHALHQHDGPRCDHSTASILEKYGVDQTYYDIAFLNQAIDRVAASLSNAMNSLEPVSHVGFGQAKVDSVASNRRVLGADGKVEIVRYSKSTNPAAIAAPEGVIDPYLKSVTFWNKDKAIANLTYYATHPQSYYGEGDVTCEFVGIARNQRQEETGVPHIHFTGAAGNVAAGKYNDGSVEMRPILASRIESAMKKSWNDMEKSPIEGKDIQWKAEDIVLPMADYLQEDFLADRITGKVEDKDLSPLSAAKHMAWLKRTNDGHITTVSALKLGDIQLLNLPGEIFVEYQLAAEAFRPDQHICTAAYEDYGPGYIGTKISYGQGGYETSMRASRVNGEAEAVLMKAIEEVLK